MYFERPVSEAVLPFQRTEAESDGKQVPGFDKQPIGASRCPMSILWRKGAKAPIYPAGMV
jgi:hypothetical protein